MSHCNQPLNLCKDSIYPKEKFWMNDVTELYKNNNYLQFYPKYETTPVTQLNAITRFCIYFIILILVFDKNEDWLYLPITLIVIGVILYNVHSYDDEGKRKEFNKILKIRREKKEHEKKLNEVELKHDGDIEYKLDIDGEKKDELGRVYDLQSGYYDSNGILRVGSKTSPIIGDLENPETLFTVDELLDYQQNTCKRPTIDNPFMNTTLMDFNNGDPPAACNADDENIKDESKVYFNHDLFRDVDELWERENSQRQFFTMPNTAVPNNQIEFAKWNWLTPPTCKEKQENCGNDIDLRRRRDPRPI
jgi:hypothetical protein